MNKQSITIIGVGNLGLAILQGLSKSEKIFKSINITRRNIDRIKHLENDVIKVSQDNVASVQSANIVILCVKPYQLQGVLNEIKEHISSETLIISAVTGILIKDIEEILGTTNKISRVMPNTASSIQEGLTCTVANKNCIEEDKNIVKEIFLCIGEVAEIEEKLMDAATVLGACGIAFVLRFIRAMIQGGIEIGFDAQTATLITTQTTLGAAKLLSINKLHPEQEIDKVTTPTGCTITGLNEMEHYGFSSSLMKGIIASFNKLRK